MAVSFDSIPHAELIQCVVRRISDREMLALIKRFLKAPVEDRTDRGPSGGKQGRDEGTPQGSPLSPLLANLYFRRFILGWKKLGLMERYQAHIVNYADDFVICCKSRAMEAMEWVRKIISKLKLQIHERKTQIHRVPEENVEFLGYTIGRCYSTKTGKSYIGTRPSKKKISRICRDISAVTNRQHVLVDVAEMIRILNRKLIGWSNYFSLGPVSRAYQAVDQHTRYRLRQWLRRKHQGQTRPGVMKYPDEYLYDSLGLVRLERRTRSFPWAKA